MIAFVFIHDTYFVKNFAYVMIICIKGNNIMQQTPNIRISLLIHVYISHVNHSYFIIHIMIIDNHENNSNDNENYEMDIQYT